MRRKSLRTLARVAHLSVDALRRRIVEKEGELLAVRGEEKRLAARLRAEMAAAERISALVNFAAYADSVKSRREALLRRAGELEGEIAALRAKLSAAFAEEKRYRILEERRLEAERREQARIEQAALDEIGLQRYGEDKAS